MKAVTRKNCALFCVIQYVHPASFISQNMDDLRKAHFVHSSYSNEDDNNDNVEQSCLLRLEQNKMAYYERVVRGSSRFYGDINGGWLCIPQKIFLTFRKIQAEKVTGKSSV